MRLRRRRCQDTHIANPNAKFNLMSTERSSMNRIYHTNLGFVNHLNLLKTKGRCCATLLYPKARTINMSSRPIGKRKTPDDEIEASRHAKTTSEEAPSTLPSTPKEVNAFAAMVNRPPLEKKPKYSSFAGKDGLRAYLDKPESFSPAIVIGHNDQRVFIRDRFPKASIHALLLPRDPQKSIMNPFDAFEDETFLTEMKKEAEQLKKLVAKDLKRRFGKFSEAEQKREEYGQRLGMGQLAEGEEEPKGRDWEREVKVGFHAGPSMNHLHIHVISREHNSTSLKKALHYNSFNTPFFVDLSELPLSKAERNHRQSSETRKRQLAQDFVCWRCNKNFGRSFVKLKEHLEIEFEAWKQE